MRAVFVLAACLVLVAGKNYMSVVCTSYSSSDCEFVGGEKTHGWTASGWFDDTIEARGFGELKIETSKGTDDQTAMYSAGLLEGFITAGRIGQSWINFVNSSIPEASLNWLGLYDFVLETIQWTEGMVSLHGTNTNDPEYAYWNHVGLVLVQLQGITDGYNKNRSHYAMLQFADLFLLNMDGDLDDLVPALKVLNGSHAGGIDLSRERIRELVAGSHCSCIVKPNKKGDRLFAAHDMWSTFAQMIEIYKHYDFPLSSPGTNAIKVSFSSYPAYISSEDDFYVLDSGLVVMETTNGVLNMSLYNIITPATLMSWVRVVVSNRMTTNGPDWVDTFSMYNSGTYNNQWIIVDTTLFVEGKPLAPNTLWIAEQIPGLIISGDVTSVVSQQGYWPSYNIPYFPEIFEKMGYPAAVAEWGAPWTYNGTARALNFRRDQGKADDIAGLQALMTYNDFENDPIAMGCPYFQIAARGDLAPADLANKWGGLCPNMPFGAINSKMTSNRLAESLGAYVHGGPTHTELPPFTWGNEAIEHVGQPKTWDYGFYYMAP